MSELPRELRRLLPDSVRDVWPALAAILPEGPYLAGGTGLAAHLRHRRSGDLDFLFHAPLDLTKLARALARKGPLEIETLDDSTLNATFTAARIQFLAVPDQAQLEPAEPLAGIPVAAVSDLMALKLNAVAKRPALRDYYDLMEIERRARLRVDVVGFDFFLRRYGAAARALKPVVGALGYLDHVDADQLLPAGKAEIAAYWQGRQPELIRSLDRFE